MPSSWHAQDVLEQDIEVDVAIIGGGYTGLWTAYYLKEAAPHLRIAILEAEFVGYGASGRNGGWASAIFPASLKKVASLSSREEAIRMQLAMNDTVAEMARVIDHEGIDCDLSSGGYVSVARSEAQWQRAKAEITGMRAWGFGADQTELLSKSETEAAIGASNVYGGTYTPHCAAIHPAKLVHGLSEVVRDLGVEIYEDTRVETIAPRALRTARGHRVTAQYIVVGTEGYSCQLPGRARDLIPMRSLMIATEPLSFEQRAELGLEKRQTFSDKRHSRIYGQVTEDNRIAFGGRGAPYNFGSKIDENGTLNLEVHDMLEEILHDFFPSLGGVEVTHRWSGVFGIPRDWTPGLQYDRASGIIQNTGYVGDGVTTTNLAGRTIRDLLIEGRSDLTTLPWVNKVAPKWEPEPLRWVAVNAVSKLLQLGDNREAKTGRPSKIVSSFWKAIGQ